MNDMDNRDSKETLVLIFFFSQHQDYIQVIQ